MTRVLFVAEKPSIAKSISQTLGGGNVRSRTGPSKYNLNYDITYNFPTWGQCEVTVTSVSGHLMGLEFPDEYRWGKCEPKALFNASVNELITDKSKKLVAQNIAKEARYADYLMIWTDCDREGEYIGYEIVQQARTYNGNITLDNVYRAKFSHLERNHISQAARNPVRLDKRAIDAVATRSELDLRAGASFTRFLSDLFKNRVPQSFPRESIVSYGGCQFPTLGFVVDRQLRIDKFKEEEFWTLSLEAKKGNSKVAFNWEGSRVFDRLVGLCIYQNCLSIDGEEATIVNIQNNPTSNWAPLPLTTVELQKDCAKYFKLSAKQSLDAAEQLYNQGFISYPRTETDSFPATMDLKSLIEKQKESPTWGGYAASLLDEPDKFRQPRAGKHDDKAHPPIHPILFAKLSKATPVQQKVYEYVVRRFLACCSHDAKGNKTTVKLKWGEEFFNTTGLVVTEKNYLDIYTYYKWESTKKIPEFQPDQRVKLAKAQLTSGKTKPPSPMTETELLGLMDANGIGTDATMAEHIEKIIFRKYITREKKADGRATVNYLKPTTVAYALVEGFNQIGLDNISLTKPFLRKNLELKLKDICEGRTTKAEVLTQTKNLYREAFAMSNAKQNLLVASYLRIRDQLQQMR